MPRQRRKQEKQEQRRSNNDFIFANLNRLFLLLLIAAYFKIIPYLKSRLNAHWKFLNVKGFVWKTMAGWFKLFPYTSLLFSVATASMRCKPKHFFQKLLFLFRKSWSYDQRLLQVYSKLHTFSSTIVDLNRMLFL